MWWVSASFTPVTALTTSHPLPAPSPTGRSRVADGLKLWNYAMDAVERPGDQNWSRSSAFADWPNGDRVRALSDGKFFHAWSTLTSRSVPAVFTPAKGRQQILRGHARSAGVVSVVVVVVVVWTWPSPPDCPPHARCARCRADRSPS
eukprot:scaffold66262_cov62-Phaeocystis_antarctica.AAC.1